MDERRRRVYMPIIDAYGTGGVPRTMFLLAGELAARGHEVEIISVERPRRVPANPLPPGVRLTWLVDRADPAGDESVKRPRPRVDPARSWPVRFLDSRPTALVDARADPAFSRFTDLALRRRLRRLRPGILLATRPELAVAAARWCAPGMLVVDQEHTTYRVRPGPLRRGVRGVADRLDAVVALTGEDRDGWRRYLRGTPVQVEVIPNASPFPVAEPARLEKPVVLAAGRLAREKGFDLLVEAFAGVADRHPAWTLQIYGRGPQERRLTRMIRRLGVEDRVRLMGYTDQLEARFLEASVFALSSRFEGLPMTLLESMSKGVPAVAFDCPTGPRHLIRDGISGLLVPPKDVDGLADGLDRLMGDAELRRELGSAALREARAYTIEAVVDRWESLFDRLVAARRQAGR